MRAFRWSMVVSATALAAMQATAMANEPVANPLNPHNIPFDAGTYRCELNRTVQIRQISPDQLTAVLQWDKKDYTLRAVSARTGALRFEDPASGLVWLVIAGKSMLLDTKQGRQLANECKS